MILNMDDDKIDNRSKSMTYHSSKRIYIDHNEKIEFEIVILYNN